MSLVVAESQSSNSSSSSLSLCDERSPNDILIYSYILLSRSTPVLTPVTPVYSDSIPSSSTVSESVPIPEYVPEVPSTSPLESISEEKEREDVVLSAQQPEEPFPIPEANIPIAMPQAAPGYSLIAQTMKRPSLSQSVESSDPDEGWEFVVPSPSPQTRSDSFNSGSSSGDSIALHRRGSFLEIRASSLRDEVEKLSESILGPDMLTTTGLNMPSLTMAKPRIPSSSSMPSSDAHSSESSDLVNSSQNLLFRNVRAVEIMRSESKYLLGLEHVLREVLGPLQAKAGVESDTMRLLRSTPSPAPSSPESSVPVLQKEEVRTIFGNLESLYVTNCNLFSNLVQIFREWNERTSTLGQLFAYYAPLLKVAYSVYLSELSNALAHVNILCKKDARFAAFLNKFTELKESEKRPLSDFLSTPLQRITRYEILLQALRKETPDGHPDSTLLDQALQIVNRTLKKINASPIEVERRAKIIELQTRFAATEIIIDPARLLLLEDELQTKKITDKSFSRQPVFLFTDCILTATLSYYGYLYKQNQFDLHSLVIMDRVDERNSEFSFWVLHPMQTHIFAFPDQDKKHQWMAAIAAAIAQLISQSPDREKSRNQFSIHLMTHNVPILIPIEAEKNSTHHAWTEIKLLQAQSQGFFGTIWSWFTPQHPS